MLSERFMLDCLSVYVEKVKEYREKGHSLYDAHSFADKYLEEVYFKDIDIEKEIEELLLRCKECHDELVKKHGLFGEEIRKSFEDVLNAFGLTFPEMSEESSKSPMAIIHSNIKYDDTTMLTNFRIK